MDRYSYEEALAASIEYFDGDEMAATAFVGKYALKNNDKTFAEKTPADSHRRIAKELARIEAKYPNPMSYEQILLLLSKRDVSGNLWSAGSGKLARIGMGPVVVQGSPMAAIGNERQIQSISNCFVVESPYDSYAGILHTDQQQAQIMKRRGGVGFDISRIRPRGQTTANAAETTDGIGIFMDRFSGTCREVAQGGRRGALMLSISVKHPEVETFIHIKRALKRVTGANISIRVTNDFMKAVDEDKDFTLQWPVDVPLSEAKQTRVVRARDIWEQIVDSAWDAAEPGVLFWDNILDNSPADIYASKGYQSQSTNPCGEIPLSVGDSCRLMVVDVTHFVKNPFTKKAKFDFKAFNADVYRAQRLMDDLVDLELEAVDRIIAKVKADPEPMAVKRIELELWEQIREAGANGRRTGLGITGLGDALAMLGIKYGSEKSVKATEDIYKALALGSYRSSVDMAEERGAFPAFEYEMEKDHAFLRRIMALDPDMAAKWKKFGRRNIANTTTAPVGTISMLTQTTSGIEPAFALEYSRWKKHNPNDKNATVDRVDATGDKWSKFTVYHHWFGQWRQISGKTDIAESPYSGATANEIDWVGSVDLQAAAQRWICHSISKTCNLPKNVSHDVVSACYMAAWKSGCKGFTAYRDGSREGVLVTNGESKYDLESRLTGIPIEELEKNFAIVDKYRKFMPEAYLEYIERAKAWVEAKKNPTEAPRPISESHAPKRPKELACKIHRINVKGETYTVLMGLLDGKPYEVFCGLSQYVEIPKKIEEGILVKNGKKDGVSTYNLLIPMGDEHLAFKDIVNLFDNPTYGAFTRTLSLAIRHGIPMQYLVEQLQKDKHSDMQSFSRVIARVLKAYVADGTKATGEKKCDNCGLEGTMVYQQNCPTCSNCGNSKCG